MRSDPMIADERDKISARAAFDRDDTHPPRDAWRCDIMDEAKPLLALDEDGRKRAIGIIEGAKGKLGKTNEDLAKLLFVSRQTFGNKLRNADFTDGELFEICLELELSVDYVTGRTTENHFAEYESPEFVARLYDSLTPRQKAAVSVILLSMVGSDAYLDLKRDELKERISKATLWAERFSRYTH